MHSFQSQPTRPARVRLAACAVSLFSAAAAAQQEVPVTQETEEDIGVVVAGPRPEPEWNCYDVEFPTAPWRAVLPNDDPNDPVRCAEILDLAKVLFADALMDEYGDVAITAGAIGGYIQDGTLHGVEFDFFPHTYDDTPKPTPGVDCLATTGILVHDDGNTTTTVGTMYCFDEDQYEARVSSLGTSGAAPEKVWLGPLVHTGYDAGKSVWILGSENTFHNDVLGSGDVVVGGFDQTFSRGLLYGLGLEVSGSGHVFGETPELAPVRALRPTPLPLAQYQAHKDYLFFPGDVTLRASGQTGGLEAYDGVSAVDAEGKIVHANGTIAVEGNGLSGTVTMIAGESVLLSMSSSLLSAAATDLLAWSLSSTEGEGISLDGSGNALEGALFSLATSVRIPGSSNKLDGHVTGWRLRVTGGQNTLSDGTR